MSTTTNAPVAELRCAKLLGALLMYAKHPATPNSPRWVSIMVPDDFLAQAEEAIAESLAAPAVSPPPAAQEVPQEVGNAELTDEQACTTYYQGNSVRHIKDKATVYGDAVMKVWFVLKKHGKHPGRTDDTVWDAIDRALASPAAPEE